MQEAAEESPTRSTPSFVEAPQEVVVGGSGSGVVSPSRSLVGGVVGGRAIAEISRRSTCATANCSCP